MVRIGIIDSGVEPTVLRKARIVGWNDLLDGTSSPVDPLGHGSKCATIIERVVEHFAPDEPIEFIVARVGSDVKAWQAFDWMASQGVAAVNISQGSQIQAPSGFEGLDALERLLRSGALPVVSGGNGYWRGPGVSFLRYYSDSPHAMSVGWATMGLRFPGYQYPNFGSNYFSDLNEDSDSGSSFAVPQTVAKAALLNQEFRNPELVWEALMATADPPLPYHGGSDPRILGPYAGDLEANEDFIYNWFLLGLCEMLGLSCASVGEARAALDPYFGPLLRTTPCNVPGGCGWGFPRYHAARQYAQQAGAPRWFRAGAVVPAAIPPDPRYPSWLPGYLVRSARARHGRTGYPMIGCHLSYAPSPVSRGVIVGHATATIQTPAGPVTLGGFGPITGDDAHLATFGHNSGLHYAGRQEYLTPAPPQGVWLPNGTFIAVLANEPVVPTFSVVWEGQRCQGTVSLL